VSGEMINRLVAVVAMAAFIGGCAVEDRAEQEWFTSGSPEADQRAEEQIAQTAQIRDETDNDAPRTLYERLGGAQGLNMIVDDFIARALNDPRVNWQRQGVEQAGFFRRGTVEWEATNENVAQLKRHMVQFLSVASGGPVRYDGQEMRSAHEGLQITNAEFDATTGLLKATLDKLGVPVDEQKELLALIETTRPQIVERR
jgi:hemoglobin